MSLLTRRAWRLSKAGSRDVTCKPGQLMEGDDAPPLSLEMGPASAPLLHSGESLGLLLCIRKGQLLSAGVQALCRRVSADGALPRSPWTEMSISR